ncbi:MAG: hypothetical protein ABJE63_07310 [Lentilitoribacter sp.]
MGEQVTTNWRGFKNNSHDFFKYLKTRSETTQLAVMSGEGYPLRYRQVMSQNA